MKNKLPCKCEEGKKCPVHGPVKEKQEIKDHNRTYLEEVDCLLGFENYGTRGRRVIRKRIGDH